MRTRVGLGMIFQWETGLSQFMEGEDIQGPTTTIQGWCALSTDTPPSMVAAILWSVTLVHEGTCPTNN